MNPSTLIRYQLLPNLTTEEYETLKADIAQRGVQVPVEYDEDGTLLDGHHRVRACQELGITTWPTVVREGLSEQQKCEHVLSLNLARRHLSREQRAELVATLRAEGWSTRRIAEQVHVSHMTVARDLEPESPVTDVTPATVTGLDGKQYPAQRVAGEAAQDAQPSMEAVKGAESPAVSVPHVSYNSGNNEWYTPEEYIEAARQVMGGIDLDPASSVRANAMIRATHFYTVDTDGLQHAWQGRLWMNPPYASDLIGKFTAKLACHIEAGDVSEAICLVNNATETSWFTRLVGVASAVVFPRGRVRFWQPEGGPGAPLQGQAVLYCGSRPNDFLTAFRDFGWGAQLG